MSPLRSYAGWSVIYPGNWEKQITLKTEGGDTELDKTVIEQLNDPLVHILRNSIDHGIELPEQRKKSGETGARNDRIEGRTFRGQRVNPH